jgi:DNA-binding transcriptional LysR family regulator
MNREDLADLLTFATIAEERSFTRAAVRLGVSASALSHSIRLLEARLGVKLLNRTTRNVAPTAAGEKLLNRLRPALIEIGAGLTTLADERSQPAGHVRISVHRTAALMLVVPKLEQLRRDFPEVVVELSVDDGLANIVAAGFDAGIRNGELLAKDMVAVRIGADYRTVLVAAPSYLKNNAAPLTPDDVALHACLGYRRPSSKALHFWDFEQDGRSVQVPVDPVFIANDSDILIHAALAGNGLAYVLKEQVESHLKSGALTQVLEGWSVTLAGSFLYYPDQRQLPAAVRVVIDSLRYRS